ncbi:MAG: cytochrome c biogenesis protein CcsA [Aquificaceae bacterium]|nr:cytochrome c biogenesis protein CcsA [Aquificaceae bacterium]
MPLLYLSLTLYFVAFLASTLSHFTNILRGLDLFFVLLALFMYMAYAVMLSFKVGSFPFADTYGFYSLLGSGMLLVLVLLSVYQPYLRKFSAVFPIVGILSTALALPAEPSPYRNPLYTLHITSALLSYALAFFAGFSSLLKIIAESRLKQKTLSTFFIPINLLRTSERFSVNMSFVFLTLTLIFGSLFSRSFFGKHWIDDPKLIYVLILWLYYVFLVHLNLLGRIKPKTLSYGAIGGMLLSGMNLLFIRHEL